MKKATRRAISGLLAFVMVFGLIGPNLSISSIAQGDVDSPKAHVHNFTCYEDYWLDCDNTDSSHTHTLDCYAHSGELVCGFEKGEVHSHNQDGVECEFVTKILVCDVPEHEHDQSCVAESTDQNTGTDSNTTDQSNAGEPSVDDGDQSSSIDQGNEDDPADTTADAGNSDSSGKDGPAEQDPDTSTIPDDSGSNVQEPDVPGTPDDSGSTDRNEDQIEDEVDVPGSGEENNSQAAVQEPQSNAGADETANEVEFSEIADNEIPVDEFNAAGVEYICGQTEHLHTSSCYQEIWKCRKTASFSLTNTDYVVGFTPTVTNKLVASSSSKAFTFSITPETSDENVIMPEDTTVTINGSGTASFKEIGFNAAGSYTFDITEQASDDTSYFCDERHWTLTVDVTEADGQFVAVGAYKQGETLSADGATFITTFTQPEGWSSSTLRQAKSIMDGMTLEEKVGQLFLLHYPGDGSGTAEQAKALIDKYHPGGYLVFDAMFANSTPDAVRSKIASAQSDSKIPMLFSVDEEGGTTASGRRIVRISSHSQYGHDPFRSPQELKAAGGLSAVAADTVDKANFLKDLGLNVNHAPVADVSGSTGYMYGRTYGGDGVENAEYVETVVANSDVNGVATTLKHFPGYGGTSSNTHNGFAENTLSWEEFLYNDLLPFRAGIAAGSHAVMVTHNTINCLDTENPASLSPAVYNMLRTEMNFDGVAMTDDLNMSAITNYVGSGKASLRALQAGADMAMTGIPDSDVPVVLAAAKDGSFPLADIEAKCLRVLCWKIEMGLIEEEVVEAVTCTPHVDVQMDEASEGHEFTFKVSPITETSNMDLPSALYLNIDKSGSYDFPAIGFKDTGEYKFRVYATYDSYYYEFTPEQWIMTVTVNYAAGKLNAEVSYSNDTATDNSASFQIIRKTHTITYTAQDFIDDVNKLVIPENSSRKELSVLKATINGILRKYNSYLPDADKELDTVKEVYIKLAAIQADVNQKYDAIPVLDVTYDMRFYFANGISKDDFFSIGYKTTGYYETDGKEYDSNYFIDRGPGWYPYNGHEISKEGTYKIKMSFSVSGYVANPASDTLTIVVSKDSDGNLTVTSKTWASNGTDISEMTISEIEGPTEEGLSFISAVNELTIPDPATPDSLKVAYDTTVTLKNNYNNLGAHDKKQAEITVAYNSLETIQTQLVALMPETDDEQAFITLVKTLPNPADVTSDTIDSLRILMEEVNTAYRKLSAISKAKAVISGYKDGIIKELQAILDYNTLNWDAKRFVTGVNNFVLPTDNLTFQVVNDLEEQISELEALHGSLDSKDRYLQIVQDAKKQLDIYKTKVDYYSDALNFKYYVSRINIDSITVSNFDAFVSNYTWANSAHHSDFKNDPITASVYPKYVKAMEIYKREINLSSAAREYYTFVNSKELPSSITSSTMQWIKNTIEEADQLYNQLSEEDKERIRVQQMQNKIASFRTVVEQEETLSSTVQAFIVSVDRIYYSIPFTDETFATFQDDLRTAWAMYKRLTTEGHTDEFGHFWMAEVDQLITKNSRSKLDTLQAIQDREINLTQAASMFVDTVNSININDSELSIEELKAELDSAINLYNSLNEEDLERLLVRNANEKLTTLQYELEAKAGLSDAATQFVDSINEITIPENITSDFLNLVSQKYDALNALYAKLTDEDKTWYSVQSAIKKLNYFTSLLSDKITAHYVIQYYAYFERLAEYGNVSLSMIDTDGVGRPHNGETLIQYYMYLNTSANATVGSFGEFATEETLIQMYESNNYDLVGEYDISRVDKLSEQNSYQLSQVWILNEGSDPTSTNPADWTVVEDISSFHLDPSIDQPNSGSDIVIRLVYSPNNNQKDVPVSFHDYDITDTKRSTKSRVYTKSYGINSAAPYSKGSCRLAFGNANAGTDYGSVSWEGNTLNKLNSRNSNGCTFDIPSRLQDGKIVYSSGIEAPRLFNEGDATGKTSYNDFSLGFTQYGDTYTISNVNHNKLGVVIDNLDKMTAISENWNHTKLIWSNSFWPMDYVESWGAPGHDVKFGAPNNLPYFNDSKSLKMPQSDDKKDHNPYFGMNFAIDFKITSDYVGPLEYYFFGDDDLWVFLDGVLVCDIGGVHSSIGEHVNLWDYIERGVDSSHTLSIFYTERGASGSTCYMRYTLPSVSTRKSSVDVEPFRFSPKVTKVVTGAEFEDTFKFNLENIGPTTGIIMPSNTICSVKGSGESMFNVITFTEPGTYKFKITEINDQQTGYIYDTSSWTLTVKVILSGSVLCAESNSIVYSKDDEVTTSTTSAEFVNGYSFAAASYAPKVTKEIQNFSLVSPETIETFKFRLMPTEFYDNAKLPDKMYVTITGEGEAQFEKIHFTAPGTYKFTIFEDIGSNRHYSYDDSVWILTIDVLEGEAGLTTNVSYQKNTGGEINSNAALFVNSFNLGRLLPATGSIGLFPIYITAGLLLTLPVVYVGIRKRKN